MRRSGVIARGLLTGLLTAVISQGALAAPAKRDSGGSAGVNTPPVANPDSASTSYETSITLKTLSNDTDPDGDRLSISAAGNPTHGSTRLGRSGITYTPPAGFSGTDAFDYTISDGRGGTSRALVTVTVAAKPNTAPMATADSASTAFATAVTIDLLGNDSDPDGDMLIITANTSATNGTVTRAGSSATYTPATGFSGTDSFTYALSDGNGGTATGVVTVSVSQPANAAPVARADSASARSGQETTVNLVSNDYDPDGDALSVVVVNPPIGGTATLSGGTLIYTPSPDFQGDDSFSYTISDGKGGSSSAVVTVRVEAAPAEPTVLRTGSASLSWTIPSTRADGSPIAMSELGGYEIYLLAESTGESRVITLADPGATSYTVDGLASDVYHFSMAASDSAGNLSELSEIVSKTVSP